MKLLSDHAFFVLIFVFFLPSFSSLESKFFATATDAFPNTDDHATTISIPRWFYWGKTANEISQLVNQNNARLTKLRVIDPSVPTFAVSMVQNTDYYGSAWWWYFGIDGNTLGSLLGQEGGRRLISIDPYWANGGLRFAVVMVPNTGIQDRAWWWYWGQTASQVGELLNAKNARLVELRPYNDNGEKFAIVMVSNTGIDYKDSEWWYGVTIQFITDKINQDNMRVVSLAPDTSGNWATILVPSEGETWYWWFGITPDKVLQNSVDHSTRLIDISPYKSGNSWVYTSVEIEDNNYPQNPINAASQTVHDHAEQNGWGGGFHGSYFVESASSLNPLIADNSYYRYEPASSIKVLYLLYTLRSGASLNDPITYYWPNKDHPDPNVCPPDAVKETPENAQTTTINNALAWMMQESNNVMTRAFAIRWGTGPVQAMARSIGMANTYLSQEYIGCGFRGGVRNALTLQDAAILYSCVDRSTCITESDRQTFFSILPGGNPSSNPIGQVVVQEAAKLGKSQVTSQFLSELNVRWKPGRYTFCLKHDSCNPFKIDYSSTGWMSIPFKPQARSFLFGSFVNDKMIDCPSGTDSCADLNNAGTEDLASAAEAARETIHQALATW